jgi:hypothetical protein
MIRMYNMISDCVRSDVARELSEHLFFTPIPRAWSMVPKVEGEKANVQALALLNQKA